MQMADNPFLSPATVFPRVVGSIAMDGPGRFPWCWIDVDHVSFMK